MISIVLPVYNGEKNIVNTLENLAQQSFYDFEVIVVNDGSVDNTQKLIEDFSKKDSRFKLINQENQGVASARNKGVENCRGEFIIHHDSDDTRPLDALEKLYNKAIETNADIVMSDYKLTFGNNSKKVVQKFSGTSEELIQDILVGKFHAGLWNKLIKKNLYDNLKFEKGINYMEDKLILIRMLLKKPSISYVDTVGYNYVQLPDSITNNLSINSYQSIKKVIEIIENEFIENNLKFDLTQTKLKYKLAAIINDISINHKEEFEEVNSLIFKTKNIALKHKILLYLELKGIKIISKIFNRLK